MGKIVNRESHVPAYYQISLSLKDRIAKKEWNLHDQLPTEADLSTEYGVSRITIRQALAELEKEGIIKKQRGKGAFVSANPKTFIHDLEYGIISGERLTQHGNHLNAEVLELKLFSNPLPGICAHLNISEESSVVFIRRLFKLEDKPLAINDSWLSAALTPDLATRGLIDGKLSKTLATYYQLYPDRVTDYLEVMRPTANQAALLETSLDSPLILLTGISYLKDGTPLEYSNTYWLGDSMRFKFQLHATSTGFEIDT